MSGMVLACLLIDLRAWNDPLVPDRHGLAAVPLLGRGQVGLTYFGMVAWITAGAPSDALTYC